MTSHPPHPPAQPSGADGDQAIIARSLSKNFGTLQAVRELSLTVAPGEIFGLVGPDGAGKTTSLRMLATILDPDSGSALVANHDVSRESSEVKDRLAYMSQKFGLYQDLTVEENIDFYADLYGIARKGRRERINDLLDFSHMRPFIKRQAGALSGGMKQKLQLVCALIHTPEVLLLDEPTNGVDPVSRRDFWRILHRLRGKGVAILIATAYLDEAERCDRVGLLNHGKLLAWGQPEELRTLLSGSLFAIRSPIARTLATRLRQQLPESGVTLFGDTVHLLSKDPAISTAALDHLLDKASLQHQKAKHIPPSLEDIFVSLLGEDESESMKSHKLETEDTQEPGNPPTSHTDKNGSPAVEVKQLTRRFGDFIAVNNISFSVQRGQIFGFLGPNGAGKSTTIRMLCGLLASSEGQGTVHGFDINREAEKIKRHIGYMSQKFSLYDDLTVAENITFYGGIYGLSGAELNKRLDNALATTGLVAQRNQMTRVLSSGWKQRLALACSILHQPPIIFLDEPTSGVDPLSRRRFWELIYQMAESGVTVFVTTHYMEEAEYCDRIALIYGGKMIATGSPMELKTHFMQDNILELRCPNPQQWLESLRRLPEIRDGSLFGSTIHLVAANEEAARAAIIRAFQNKGRDDLRSDGETFRLTTVLPSMEDVFISLIEEVDRKENINRGDRR